MPHNSPSLDMIFITSYIIYTSLYRPQVSESNRDDYRHLEREPANPLKHMTSLQTHPIYIMLEEKKQNHIRFHAKRAKLQVTLEVSTSFPASGRIARAHPRGSRCFPEEPATCHTPLEYITLTYTRSLHAILNSCIQ